MQHQEPLATAPWADDIPPQAWADVESALIEARDSGEAVVLVCHVHPDGDALGSMLAMHCFLRARGVRTVASWGDEPFRVPPAYTFLPGIDTVVAPEDVPTAPSLVLTFDAGRAERLGRLESVFHGARRTVVIDHHATNERFGDVNLVSPNAASTASVVEELIRRLGGSLDADLATLLYVGLVTDTGRFQYTNTDQAAMEFGARLMDQDIRHTEISRRMFGMHSFGYLKVLGRVLDRATFVPDVKLLHSHIQADDLDRFGVESGELVDIIDTLRTIDAADVTLLARPGPRGWQVSLRSHSRTDVGRLAASFDGGGHEFSAGFDYEGTIEDLVAEVRGRLLGRQPSAREEGAA